MANQPTFRSAVFWAYTMNWGEKGFGALFSLLLASLLGPRDFGVLALAMIYISFIQMLLDQGLFAALIQRKDLRPEHLDSVFWMDILLSLVFVGLSVVFGGWWARINHLRELHLVISVLSISFPVEGFALVQRAILHRQMDFKSLSIRSNLSVLIGGAVGLGMAFRGLGVWALVGLRLSEDIAALILLWSVSNWRPRWRFSARSLKELLGFSTASFATKLGGFTYGQADALLMGMFFGPVAVGLFRLAERLMNLVHEAVTNALQAVSFPQFSRLQDEPSELRRSVLSCLRMSSIVTLPAMAGLAMTSNFLMAVIGPRWAAAADVLKVLCVLGVALTFAKFTGPLLMAKSRASSIAALTWAINVVNIGALVMFASFLKQASIQKQIVGIAFVRLTVGAFLMTPLFLFILLRLCRISVKEFVSSILPSVLAAAAVLVVIAGINGAVQAYNVKPAMALCASAIAGGLAAAGTLLMTDRQLRSATFYLDL